MSEHNEEAYGEMARLSRRIVLVEQMLLRRILALEGEVAALKASRSDTQPEGQDEREVYPDAQAIEWRERGAARWALDRIMRK